MDTKCVAQMIQVAAERYGDNPALCLQDGDSNEKYSYRGLNHASGRVATGLIQFGVKPGDRVAILSESRPRWGMAFFAAIRAGAVVVPLDVRQSANELKSVMVDAEPTLLLFSDAQRKAAENLANSGVGDFQLLSIEPETITPEYPSIDEIAAAGVQTTVVRESEDAAVLTYTSGTMGTSKGVVTTHGNLLYQIRSFRQVLLNDTHVSVVSILPLSHLFELTAGFLGVL